MIVIRSKRIRDVLRVTLPFIGMPALIVLGTVAFSEKQHLIVSLGMACMALLFFLTGFEKRKTGGRRMVIVSVMTALCIVGRLIPLFKPVTALIIITAGAGQRPGETRIDLAHRNAEIFRSIVGQIIRYTRDAILLVVTNPVDVLTYITLRMSGYPPNRVIGSGTVLDTARWAGVCA